jgi:tetratricopeptide (TPR) repeat protein
MNHKRLYDLLDDNIYKKNKIDLDIVAINHYNNIINMIDQLKNNDDMISKTKLILLYMNVNNYDEAERICNNLLNNKIDNYDEENIKTILAKIYYKQNKYELAETIYKELDNNYLLGMLYKEQNKVDLAIENLIKAQINEYDNDNDTYKIIGDLYFDKKDIINAKEYYYKYISKSYKTTYNKDIINDILNKLDIIDNDDSEFIYFMMKFLMIIDKTYMKFYKYYDSKYNKLTNTDKIKIHNKILTTINPVYIDEYIVKSLSIFNEMSENDKNNMKKYIDEQIVMFNNMITKNNIKQFLCYKEYFNDNNKIILNNLIYECYVLKSILKLDNVETCYICNINKEIIELNCSDKHKVCYECYGKLNKCPYCRKNIKLSFN